MFTQRHYIKIAKLLKDIDAPITVIHAFIIMFRDDSEKFDTNTFMNAVYGKEKKS